LSSVRPMSYRRDGWTCCVRRPAAFKRWANDGEPVGHGPALATDNRAEHGDPERAYGALGARRLTLPAELAAAKIPAAGRLSPQQVLTIRTCAQAAFQMSTPGLPRAAPLVRRASSQCHAASIRARRRRSVSTPTNLQHAGPGDDDRRRRSCEYRGNGPLRRQGYRIAGIDRDRLRRCCSRISARMCRLITGHVRASRVGSIRKDILNRSRPAGADLAAWRRGSC
jgi:hypothetical protein